MDAVGEGWPWKRTRGSREWSVESLEREEKTLKATAVELGYVTEKELDEWICPEKMTGPGG